jgi:uncharacterized membrane protein required for colicin V production
MGLDLALGGLVLITAIRGWLKGFLIQAIRLGGLVAAVYVAAPVRDETKPYVLDYLPSIRADLVDRMLWWASAVVSYFVMVGVASLAVSMSRRKTFGIAEPNRGDQFAGLGLGLIKGLVVASFVVAGLQKYAQPQIAQLAWIQEQTKESYAWEWNEQYHPAARIWSAVPVQHFVGQIRKMGLNPSGETEADESEKSVQTASRTPQLSLQTTHPVPSPPHRRKLVLRKPFDDPALSTRASSTGRPDSPSEPLKDPSGFDPNVLRVIESLKGQSPGSAVSPGLMPGPELNSPKWR